MNSTELEPDRLFVSGPASNRPVHFREKTGENPAKINEHKSNLFILNDDVENFQYLRVEI